MNPTVVSPEVSELGREWGHTGSVFRKRILWTTRHISSPTSWDVHRRRVRFVFFRGKSERSVSRLTHCGQAVVFTLDSNTQKDEYRSVHLCIAWAFGAFNASLIRWEIHVFTQSELRTFSRVIFKPLKGIPIWRCQLTALFKGLVHFPFTNQAF